MLRRMPSLCALIVSILLPAALLRADEPPKGDKDLDGDWDVAKYVSDGLEVPPPPVRKGTHPVTIKGDAFAFNIGDAATATIKVDASKTPRTMDLAFESGPRKGKIELAIYDVKDDELRICIAAPEKDRPTEFSSKMGSGSEVIMLC